MTRLRKLMLEELQRRNFSLETIRGISREPLDSAGTAVICERAGMERADPNGDCKPQRATPVLRDKGNLIAIQTVFSTVIREFAVSKAVKPMLLGTDPEGAIAIYIESMNAIRPRDAGNRAMR